MDPMLDPDLIEFMDDETLLAAFERACTDGDDGDRRAIIAELGRRDLTPIATPRRAAIIETSRVDPRLIPLRL